MAAVSVAVVCTFVAACALAVGDRRSVESARATSHVRAVDDVSCDDVLEMTPDEADADLAARGYRVEWRYMETTAAGTVAEPADHPPAGVIVDVWFGGAEVYVFVMSPDDPSFDEQPMRAGCGEG